VAQPLVVGKRIGLRWLGPPPVQLLTGAIEEILGRNFLSYAQQIWGT
jgi:hypothetical protein